MPLPTMEVAFSICIKMSIQFKVSEHEPNKSLVYVHFEKIFTQQQVVGVRTKEIVYGGGNIHCTTMNHNKSHLLANESIAATESTSINTKMDFKPKNTLKIRKKYERLSNQQSSHWRTRSHLPYRH
ncbi:agmatine deiminase family protein [Psychrobacter pacificensis]|uniref:agmatine deiminase family protein n=1 Tax=Psychrobacter pacificensis TaxID=112002 RepID=UPI003D2D1689